MELGVHISKHLVSPLSIWCLAEIKLSGSVRYAVLSIVARLLIFYGAHSLPQASISSGEHTCYFVWVLPHYRYVTVVFKPNYVASWQNQGRAALIRVHIAAQPAMPSLPMKPVVHTRP